MRHGNKIKKIGRNAAHRKATLQSMSISLIEHKRITTTLGKARALRVFVEPILNRAKDDSTHSRRQAFRYLQNKEAVKALYGDVASAIGDRPGGYTRIVKLGQRDGDAAEMAVIELVDFNNTKPEGAAGTRRKTRRSRGRTGSTAATAAAPAAAAPAGLEVIDEEPAAPDTVEEAASEIAEVADEAVDATEETAADEAPAAADEPAEPTAAEDEPAAEADAADAEAADDEEPKA